MLDLRGSHGSFDTKPELISPWRQQFRNNLSGSGCPGGKGGGKLISRSVLPPGTRVRCVSAGSSPALPCLPRGEGFLKAFYWVVLALPKGLLFCIEPLSLFPWIKNQSRFSPHLLGTVWVNPRYSAEPALAARAEPAGPPSLPSCSWERHKVRQPLAFASLLSRLSAML